VAAEKFHDLFVASASVAGALIGGPSIGLASELGALVRDRGPD